MFAVFSVKIIDSLNDVKNFPNKIKLESFWKNKSFFGIQEIKISRIYIKFYTNDKIVIEVRK